MHIAVFTTGGTIDKSYFDANSTFQVGAPQIQSLLQRACVGFTFEVVELMRKDSLEVTAADRDLIKTCILECPATKILVTHGTDTIVETARILVSPGDKTIVLTGSLQPARFSESDAPLNVGLALGALQTCSAGVYIAMNGRVFDALRVRKNLIAQRFEDA